MREEGAAVEVAVLIPCYNEEATVAEVVDAFKGALPAATVYVYDNNSSDKTAEIAVAHGAVVRKAPKQGKGNVVRQMLAEVDADAYVLVDGDMTYSADDAARLLEPILRDEVDMVVGDRLSGGDYAAENKRALHGFGNSLVAWLIKTAYGSGVPDVMTGYRAFNRDFAKMLPVLSEGFEIETEMTIHALDSGWRVESIEVAYADRPDGSESKLNTFSDGARVLAAFGNLLRYRRPLAFFGALAVALLAACLACGVAPIFDYASTGAVQHVPLCIAAAGAGLLSASALFAGLILDSVANASRRFYSIAVMNRPRRWAAGRTEHPFAYPAP